jgi:hypothetical protein
MTREQIAGEMSTNTKPQNSKLGHNKILANPISFMQNSEFT